MFVFIPTPVRVGTLLMEVPGTPIGASFFEFELKHTGKDSADPTQHEFQHHSYWKMNLQVQIRISQNNDLRVI